MSSILNNALNKQDINFFTSVIDELNMSVLNQIPEYRYQSSNITIIPPIPPVPPKPIPCFLKGTKIMTEKGEELIENLQKGTYLINHKGEKLKLVDIHSFKTSKNKLTHPCLIAKGIIINGNKCNSNLYLSPEHALLIKNTFIPVRKFIKQQIFENEKDYYMYYHLITENFYTDVIIANGIETETYGKFIKHINRDLYSYLKKHIIDKDGNRVLVNTFEFQKLVKEFYKLKNTNHNKEKINNLKQLKIQF